MSFETSIVSLTIDLKFLFTHAGKCTKDGIYASASDCSIFYECRAGQLTELHCAYGYVFNADTLKCDVLENVPDCLQVILPSGMNSASNSTKTKKPVSP